MSNYEFALAFLILLGGIASWYAFDDWRRNRHNPDRQPIESTPANFDYLSIDGDQVEVRR